MRGREMTGLGEFWTGMVLGVHLFSVHSQPGMNSNTAGLYLRAPSGFTAGFYENSLSGTTQKGHDGSRRTSTYAGWSWETDDRNWALTIAGATGYSRPESRVCIERSASDGS